jgi:hypothetical protein
MAEVHITVKAEVPQTTAWLVRLGPLIETLRLRGTSALDTEQAAALGQQLVDAYADAGFEFKLTADEDLYGSHRREPWRFPGEAVAALRGATVAGEPLVQLAHKPARKGQVVLNLEAGDDYPDAVGRFYAELLAFCGCRQSRYALECDEWDCMQ